MIPGEVFTAAGDITLNAGAKVTVLMVANTGDRPVQVGSHYHFAETNPGAAFDRKTAQGQRLDIPAGTDLRFEPGPSREVRLVPYGGARRVFGFNARVMGDLQARRIDRAPDTLPPSRHTFSIGETAMCNACVLESVKSTMLSRRSLFRGVAASGAAAVAAGLVGARPALAQSSGRVVDLTHTLDAAFPTFDGKPGITIDKVVDFAKDGYNINKLTILEHSGTHIDTPLHFTADGASVDELAPEKLVCPLCVIDIRAKAAEDPNAMVLPEDIEAWVSANGAIAAGSLVAMNSGWAAKIGDASFRNTPDGKLAFPGFSKAATEMLAGLDVAAIGVDTLSLDPGDSADFAVHYQWLPSGRYGVENMAGLDGVPAAGATIFVGAPKHRKGSGGPARVMAVV